MCVGDVGERDLCAMGVRRVCDGMIKFNSAWE